MKKLIMLVGVLAVALVLPTAVSAKSAGSGSAGSTAQPPQAHTSVVRDCAWATKHTRFMGVRVKKVRKRVANGQLPVWKLKAALRIYKQAVRFQNQVCSPGGGGGGGPAPLALTATEVANRVFSQARAYCDVDAYCVSYGSFATSTCASQATYEWKCYGYNQEASGYPYYGARCDFREVVSRSGYNGITSYRDLTYGGSDGFYC